MTRTEPDDSTVTAADPIQTDGTPETTDPAAINKEMSVRLLTRPPDPIEEGSYATRVLRSTGRVSGEQHLTPIAVVRQGGHDYLISPVRQRDWVQNLLAEPTAEILTMDGGSKVTAEPAAGDEAVAAVATYVRTMRVPWAIKAFPVDATSSAEDITGHLDELAVFRIG